MLTLTTRSQLPALREFAASGRPIWGTCAGLIFLADRALGECCIAQSPSVPPASRHHQARSRAARRSSVALTSR